MDQKHLLEELAKTLKEEKLPTEGADDGTERPFFDRVKDIFG